MNKICCYSVTGLFILSFYLLAQTKVPSNSIESKAKQSIKTTKEGQQIFSVPRLFLADSWNNGWFRASGSWVIAKEAMPSYLFSQEEAIDFNCYKDLGVCIESTASVSMFGGLAARTEIYEIQTWSSEQIQTKPSIELCGSFQITVNRNGKKVFATKTYTSKKSIICLEPGTVELMELKTTQ